MNFFIKPFTILFSLTLITGIFIALTSNNWIFLWAGLELNLYSFIPLVLTTKKNQEKEAIIKYFFAQSIASIILLFTILTPQTQPLLLISRILIKIGAAPCHFWLPPVITSISWSICWVLSTLQKITPIFVLALLITHLEPAVIALISISSAIVGGVGGLNQTQLRAILAYSSIGHMGWMLARTLISQSATLFYFISYIFIISTVIKPLSLRSIFIVNNPSFITSHLRTKLSLIPSLLSLAGLPPIFGFFPKLIVITSLSHLHFPILQLTLISASSINLYYYLKVITISSFISQKQNTNFYYMPHTSFLMLTLIRTSSGILLFPLFFN